MQVIFKNAVPSLSTAKAQLHTICTLANTTTTPQIPARNNSPIPNANHPGTVLPPSRRCRATAFPCNPPAVIRISTTRPNAISESATLALATPIQIAAAVTTIPAISTETLRPALPIRL